MKSILGFREILLFFFAGVIFFHFTNAFEDSTVNESINNQSTLHHHNHKRLSCDHFLAPINEKRNKCRSESNQEVDICVVFAGDYEYLILSLVHHLSLGFRMIHIYNSDENTLWYYNPAILCMLKAELISITPWFKMSDISAYNKCFAKLLDYSPKGIALNTWGAVFDADEYVLLHKHTCINKFMEDYSKVPGVCLNWAFFIPESPLSDEAVQGYDKIPTKVIFPNSTHGRAHSNNIYYRNSLAYEVMNRRWSEIEYIKTIARVPCVELWYSPHTPTYKNCGDGIGALPMDPQQKILQVDYKTPWVDNNYPIAQLNHYWSDSVKHFLRKIHRGYGAGYDKTKDTARPTDQFFANSKLNRANIKFVTDNAFFDKYNDHLQSIIGRCPWCFDYKYIAGLQYQ